MEQDERKLWELYKETGRKELLELIVNNNLRLVHYIVNRLNIYASNCIDKEDLYSVGVLGLLDAIEKFDLEKGVEFKTYATLRVRGAIIDEIRRLDWVPRSVRQKVKSIDAATHKLFEKLQRMPTDEEIADELDISIEDYYAITDNMSSLFLVSLDSVYSSENGTGTRGDNLADDSIQDEDQKRYKLKIKEKLTEAIGQLPRKEKLVVTLYYYEKLNLKEIGEVLKVSESRVSQIHSSAILKLRSAIDELHNSFFFS